MCQFFCDPGTTLGILFMTSFCAPEAGKNLSRHAECVQSPVREYHNGLRHQRQPGHKAASHQGHAHRQEGDAKTD